MIPYIFGGMGFQTFDVVLIFTSLSGKWREKKKNTKVCRERWSYCSPYLSPMEESQPPGVNPTSKISKDTGYLPGDDAWTQWRNIFSILSGKMTDEGKEQYRLARDIRNEAVDCKRCEDQRDYLLQYSEESSYSLSAATFCCMSWHSTWGPVIRFLQDNIKQLGGNISSHNIYCRRCTKRRAGGFDPDYGIQICANEMRDQGHLEDTLAHEMVHAYDHLRFKLDWTDNLRHAACTEVGLSKFCSLSSSRFLSRISDWKNTCYDRKLYRGMRR